MGSAEAHRSSPVLQRKQACACGGGCPRCNKNKLPVQTKLAVSEPGDVYPGAEESVLRCKRTDPSDENCSAS